MCSSRVDLILVRFIDFCIRIDRCYLCFHGCNSRVVAIHFIIHESVYFRDERLYLSAFFASKQILLILCQAVIVVFELSDLNAIFLSKRIRLRIDERVIEGFNVVHYLLICRLPVRNYCDLMHVAEVAIPVLVAVTIMRKIRTARSQFICVLSSVFDICIVIHEFVRSLSCLYRNGKYYSIISTPSPEQLIERCFVCTGLVGPSNRDLSISRYHFRIDRSRSSAVRDY